MRHRSVSRALRVAVGLLLATAAAIGLASPARAADDAAGTVHEAPAGVLPAGVRDGPDAARALLPAGTEGRAWRFRLHELDGIPLAPDAAQYAARTTARGPLLVFLPATGSVPSDYRAFLAVATSVGYHVLGLDYDDLGRSVTNTCGVDPSCYGLVQRNRFDGSHPSRFSDVGRAGAVLPRLVRSLRILAERDPAGGWGRYLDDGRVRWDRVVLAGHSQGGGESAWIAHRHVVRGVLMFSSPVDSDGRSAASWLLTRSATPASREYGFDDAHDVYADRILPTWTRMGLATAPLPGVTGGSHQIVTHRDLGGPFPAHGRIVKDSTPLGADGTPVFAPVWHWMLERVR